MWFTSWWHPIFNHLKDTAHDIDTTLCICLTEQDLAFLLIQVLNYLAYLVSTWQGCGCPTMNDHHHYTYNTFIPALSFSADHSCVPQSQWETCTSGTAPHQCPASLPPQHPALDTASSPRAAPLYSAKAGSHLPHTPNNVRYWGMLLLLTQHHLVTLCSIPSLW